MWILAWGAEHVPRLLTGSISWTGFWNANIFHPEPLALALSEHLFGQTLQILPVYWLTGNIILCYNLLFISTFALSAFGTYLLVRDLTGDRRAAFLAGLIYGFLPYRIASVPHLQVLSSQWMPFTLFGLNRLSDDRIANSALVVRYRRARDAELVVRLLPALLRAVRTVVRDPSHVDPWAPSAPSRIWISLECCRCWHACALTLPFLLPYRTGAAAVRLRAADRRGGTLSRPGLLSYLTASENVRALRRPAPRQPRNRTASCSWDSFPLLLAIIARRGLSSRRSQQSPGHSRHRSRPERAGLSHVLLAVAAATQFLALMNVMLFGGLDVTIAGIRLRATTPARLAVQFRGGVWTCSSPCSKRARDRRHRMRRRGARRSVMFACMIALAVWLSFGPNYGIYWCPLRLRPWLQRRPRARALRDDRRIVSRGARGLRRPILHS